MHNGKRLHLLAGVKFVFVAILVLFLVEPQLFFHHMNPLEEATVPVLIMEDKHGITVMTYNVRHGRGIDGRVDLERIAAVIRESEADIVALQEVDRYWWRSGMEDQIRRLGEKLEMSWVYAPAIAAGWMQYGNAVLSRFPLVEGEMVLLPGWREPRNMMRVLVEIDGVPVELINTHLGVHAGERGKCSFRICWTVSPRSQRWPFCSVILICVKTIRCSKAFWNIGGGWNLMLPRFAAAIGSIIFLCADR